MDNMSQKNKWVKFVILQQNREDIFFLQIGTKLDNFRSKADNF